MLINLSELISKEGKVVEKQASVEMTDFKAQIGTFPILEKQPFQLKITNIGKDKLTIEGKVDLSLLIPCDRCLEDVKTEFQLEIFREIDMKLSEEDRMKELEDNNFISGYDLDIDKLVYTEILVNWPMKILCNENCKGICNRCGTNLNYGACDCDTTVLDPRMAVIRDIFENYKEV